MARSEWMLERIFEQASKCTCGHAIVDNYLIYNPNTAKRLCIGSVCIGQFPRIGLTRSRGRGGGGRNNGNNIVVPPSHIGSRELKLALTSLKRLMADKSATANVELLRLCCDMTVISNSDLEWYLKVATGTGSRFRHNPTDTRFSSKMAAIKARINKLILLGMSPGRPYCCHGQEQMMPRFSPKRNKYFYTCPNYKDKVNRGCGLFRWA
jgi:hypothetical protein